MQAHGITLHHFHGGSHPAVQGSISAEGLADLIQYVGRDRIVPAGDWLRRALLDELRPGDVCLTFDDNLRCQYDVALPVMRDYGLTAFWFVQTSVLQGHVERPEVYRAFRTRCFDDADTFYEAFYGVLDGAELARALRGFNPAQDLAETSSSDADRQFRYVRDELLGPARYREAMDRLIAAHGLTLRELAQGLWMKPAHLYGLYAEGHIIGLHSHTHPTRLADLSPEEQRREYQMNFACLSQLLHAAPTTMSHPCNSYDEGTLALLRRLGIVVGFRADFARRPHDALEYPRANHADLVRETQSCASSCSCATSPAMAP